MRPHLLHKVACPFAWKVLIALHEAGLTFSEEVVDDLGPDRLADLSPTGTTPILVRGDLVLWESSVIAEYVNDRADGALMPTDARGRARVRQLHVYADRVIGPGLREVIFEKRSGSSDTWDGDRIARGTAAWRRCLDWLEQRVESSLGFVDGRFTLADCALVPRFALADRFGVGVDGADHPRLAAWYAVQLHRQSVAGTRPECYGWKTPVPAS